MDTAEAESTGQHAAPDEAGEQAPAEQADGGTARESAEAPEQSAAEESPKQDPAQFAGFPGQSDQTMAFPQAGMPSYAAPTGPEPYGPYPTGQFAPPPYGPPAGEPFPTGQYQPVDHSGNHQTVTMSDQQGPGYGEYRQEIGPDGLVRRVFPEAPQPDAQEHPAGPIYSWAPPPPPMHQPAPPQMYQQPPVGPPPGQGQPWQQPNPHQPQQPFQPQHVPAPGQPGHSVNDLNLLKRARKAPRSGWRRAVHKASGGIINPGESAADVVFRDLVDRVNQPVRGDYRIAILSLKGGVGKTTTTVGLGSTFSSLRGDRVIAIDANPDLGTLAHRVPRQTRSTVRNLLEDQHITRYSDVRAHTSQAPSRLEVLASEQDPAVSEAFSEADYRKAIGILQAFYNIILTDCGTGLMHSAMAGVLDMASSLVLVTSPAIDGARSASATLDWLDHHGYGKLVERTVVVVNASRRGASTVDLDQLRKLFLDRTRAVQVVPFDDHLAEGAEIDLELVSKPTRRALLELAAMVADDFGYVGSQQYGTPPHIGPGHPNQHGHGRHH
ncbi:AAA family ATPase [Nocardia sp. NPDC052566]|uniref:MinD/ParA family ATP-binding protein n=1 Tax=Nocardia sp. NPDC052566 TaxID=3364330 RepID=UPI0037C6D2D0